jgi:hypothetical protein
MRLFGFKSLVLAALFLIFLISACAPLLTDPQGVLPDTSETIPTMMPSLQSGSSSETQPASVTDPSLTPNEVASTQTTTVNETQLPQVADWRKVPIMPEVSQRVLEIYQDGQAQGRNPHNFSVIGDCQAIPFVFMGPYERGELKPDSAENYLWSAIDQFKGSFVREGMAVRGGFTAASILSPIQADAHYCISGETPLTCEYRLHNPAFVFITLETWRDPNTVERYETYLRKILDYVIERGTVPILLTKADSSELKNGTHVINPIIVQVASDYDVPVINFWWSAQYFDNYGIDPARDGFHLSNEGYKLKNVLALRTLYKVWNAVEKSGVTGNSNEGNVNAGDLASVPTAQGTPTSRTSPRVTVPECDGGCVFFATAASQDGVIILQGIYAYAFRSQKMNLVLGEGFDLQDVSEDGQRLLVNQGSLLYEINLADASANLISETMFALGKQSAYWNKDDSNVIFIDQNKPFQAETGAAFNLIPSANDEEIYFDTGSCTYKDYCKSNGIFRLNLDRSATALEYFHPVFSPDGSLMAFLNPADARKVNYYHIGEDILLEETEQGIRSRRLFYFPKESGFMVHPDVRDYSFSPENNKLFILYDVYSAYFEKSLSLQNYMLDVKTGKLYDYGKLNGISGSLNPRLTWSPQSNMVLLFLTDTTPDNQYSLNIFQAGMGAGETITPYDQGILLNKDYFYITNLYWR